MSELERKRRRRRRWRRRWRGEMSVQCEVSALDYHLGPIRVKVPVSGYCCCSWLRCERRYRVQESSPESLEDARQQLRRRAFFIVQVVFSRPAVQSAMFLCRLCRRQRVHLHQVSPQEPPRSSPLLFFLDQVRQESPATVRDFFLMQITKYKVNAFLAPVCQIVGRTYELRPIPHGSPAAPTGPSLQGRRSWSCQAVVNRGGRDVDTPTGSAAVAVAGAEVPVRESSGLVWAWPDSSSEGKPLSCSQLDTV